MAMMSVNIFEKIIRKEIPAKIIHEDEWCLAFHDVNPQAPIHILIIPRQVIPTHDAMTETDKLTLGHMNWVAVQLAQRLGITEEGYRLVINCKDAGGQTVPHLHMHLLAGRAMHWPPG